MLDLDIIELYNKVRESKKCLHPSEIRAIRVGQYNMTQGNFAQLIGVVLDTYRTWEQGRWVPSSAAQSLLSIARDYPEIFLKNRERFIKLFYDTRA